ncbi:hypothetical protein [Anaerosalibacter bizertensis]|uniref:hypothetical protein n=1 Tax=Anaerosalibacter bizertensis TaxID=932217 RepID=UPI0035161AA2
MKKKSLFLLSLLLITFSTSHVLASSDDVIPTDEVEVLELEEEIEGLIEEVDEIIEENQEIINEEEEIEEELEEIENLTELGDKIEDSIKKSRFILDAIENQYNMKRQFVHNSKDAYNLTIQLKNNLNEVNGEIKNIIKDKDKTIDKETYGEIREITSHISSAIKESEYIAGSILRETKNYAGYLKNRQFKEASKSFQRILSLQNEQINLLKTVNEDIGQLNIILENI